MKAPGFKLLKALPFQTIGFSKRQPAPLYLAAASAPCYASWSSPGAASSDAFQRACAAAKARLASEEGEGTRRLGLLVVAVLTTGRKVAAFTASDVVAFGGAAASSYVEDRFAALFELTRRHRYAPLHPERAVRVTRAPSGPAFGAADFHLDADLAGGACNVGGTYTHLSKRYRAAAAAAEDDESFASPEGRGATDTRREEQEEAREV